jgi:hypothetical protein
VTLEQTQEEGLQNSNSEEDMSLLKAKG